MARPDGATEMLLDNRETASKQEFESQLDEARRSRTDNIAERGAVYVSIHRLRPEKLRVVEDVEAFDPELQGLGFVQWYVFHNGHVVVIHARAVKEAALGVAGSAQGVFGEERGTEIGLPVSGIAIQVERSAGVVRFVHAKVVDAIRFCA